MTSEDLQLLGLVSGEVFVFLEAEGRLTCGTCGPFSVLVICVGDSDVF